MIQKKSNTVNYRAEHEKSRYWHDFGPQLIQDIFYSGKLIKSEQNTSSKILTMHIPYYKEQS